MDQADDDAAIVERVPARAALAGNPSDGYAGAVFAIPVDAYAATVTLRPAARWSLGDELSGRRTFEHANQLHLTAHQAKADAPHALLLATIADFVERTGTDLPPCSIDVASSIPVRVGLAGSSAIVIGTVRALYRSARLTAPSDVSLAAIAWEIENRRLGITAGMQDRLVQAHGRPVLMRFDHPAELGVELSTGADRTSTAVAEPGTDMMLLVAHRQGLSESSHVVHSDLRQRFDAGDLGVRDAMSQLRAHAMSARNAFEAGDVVLLGESMNATYDLRARMIDLEPGHVEMIDAARQAGSAANYTGSGGAIVVLSPTGEVDLEARQSLNRLGCDVVAVELGPAAPRPAEALAPPPPRP